MAEKYRRYFLKDKETKLFLNRVSKRIKFNLKQILSPKVKMELIETEFAEIYVFDGKPILAKTGEIIFPTLVFSEFLDSAPKVIIDMGAVPHICNGAGIMAPGIVRFEGQFEKTISFLLWMKSIINHWLLAKLYLAQTKQRKLSRELSLKTFILLAIGYGNS